MHYVCMQLACLQDTVATQKFLDMCWNVLLACERVIQRLVAEAEHEGKSTSKCKA